MSSNNAEHAFDFMKWLFDPVTVSTIVTFTSIVSAGTVRVWKKLEKKQNKDIEAVRTDVKELSDSVHATLDEVKLDNLRLQILSGLNPDSVMSMKEVMFLYDQYRSLGGNSYITRLVDEASRNKK